MAHILRMFAQKLLDCGNASSTGGSVMTSLEESLGPRVRLAFWHLQVFALVFAQIATIFAFCSMNCKLFCIPMMSHVRA